MTSRSAQSAPPASSLFDSTLNNKDVWWGLTPLPHKNGGARPPFFSRILKAEDCSKVAPQRRTER